MAKKGIYTFAINFLKRIVNKLYYAGVFSVMDNTRRDLSKINISIGADSHVDPSSVLITNGNATIILKGNNRIGRSTELQPSVNGTIKIGYGSSIQDRNIILGDVEIGKYCLTAPNVYMSSGRHYFDLDPNFYIKDQDAMVHSSDDLSKQHSKKIIIEDDVWIGINAVIMSGVTIRRGSIIGSNSVVTNDVDPFSIMVGAPAKLIKKRLEFVPKSILNFMNDSDLPNFYSGFFVNLKNLEEDRKSGGIGASNSFKAYLNNTASKVQLTIKKIVDFPVTLNYNNQDVILSQSNFENISFDISNTNYHQFTVNHEKIDEDQKVFLVKEIKVLS